MLSYRHTVWAMFVAWEQGVREGKVRFVYVWRH